MTYSIILLLDMCIVAAGGGPEGGVYQVQAGPPTPRVLYTYTPVFHIRVNIYEVLHTVLYSKIVE